MAINGLPQNTYGSWYSAAGSQKQVLPSETQKLLQEAFGFKGVKIVQVEKGIQVNALKTLEELSTQKSVMINQEIAESLGISSTLESVLVVVGGTELIKSRLKELEKSIRRLDKKSISKLSKALGLLGNEDVLLFIQDQTTTDGGLLIVQAGLQEIEESL